MVAQEALVLLSGGRAVLLQLAHPLVAHGVAKYSNFQSDPLARLFRTMLFMDAVLLDDERRPEALSRFHAMHDRIRGRLPTGAGAFDAGIPYEGSDPRLKLWVHTTLVDSCLKTYELFVRPLSEKEHQRYFSDSLTFARLLKIPADLRPNTTEEFENYMRKMVSSGELEVTDTARTLAESVLYPDVSMIPRASAGVLRFVTAGLLPARIREEYGLTWTETRQKTLETMGAITRALRPLAPKWLWQSPLLEGRVARILLKTSDYTS